MILNKQFFRFASEIGSSLFQLPPKDNFIFFSRLKEGYTPNAFRSFSIKMAAEGFINYKIRKTNYKVSGDRILLASRQSFGPGYIESENYTRSICIDITEEILAETFTIMSARDDYDFDNYLCDYFVYPNFAEHTCDLEECIFSNKLRQLKNSLLTETFDRLNITDEWFFDLSEKIILQESNICKALNGIDSVKFSTRKETLTRLNKGKKYIDENFAKNPGIREVAEFCGMSQFHFYRTFRQAFRLTPYQYLLKKRLEYSTNLINSTKKNLAEIAGSCGFHDQFTFSKAFKRYYGKTPSTLR